MQSNLIYTAFYVSLILLVAILLVAVAVMFYKIILELFEIASRKAFKHKHAMLKEAEEKAATILEKAQEEARQTVMQANETAATHISTTNAFIENLNKEHENMLIKNTNLHTQSLDEEYGALKNQYEKTLEDTSNRSVAVLENMEKMTQEHMNAVLNKLDAQIESEVSVLHAEVLQKLEEAQDTFEDKSAEAYEKVLAELAEYKSSKITSINTSIYTVLSEVSRRVLGRALSLEDHQEYILKSLDEAKQLLNE